jgi:fatty-acyl-CoA synthase
MSNMPGTATAELSVRSAGKDATITDVLRQRAAENPGGIAYWFDGIAYSWAEVDRISDCLALSLLKQGAAKGSMVGIWGYNTIAWMLYFYGLQKIGAVAVLLNYSYKEEEADYVLRQTDISHLLIGEGKNGLSYAAVAEKLCSKLPSPVEWTDMEAAFRAVPAGERRVPPSPPGNSGAAACVIYTSGTTARPRAVLLSHRNLMENARVVVRRLGWTKDDRILQCMPLFHCSGLTAGVLLGLQAGAPVVLLRHFQAVPVMEQIQRYRCTAFNVVPSMILFILHHPDRGNYDLSSLKSGIVAGANLSPEKYRAVNEVFPDYQMLPAYGQTETAPLVTMAEYTDSFEKKACTAGKALEGIKVRVANCETEADAPPGELGEIQVKGFCVMQGYYGQSGATAKKFTSKGWLRTGDVGFLDNEGYLHIAGRMGDIIIRGGENIAAQEVEHCIEHFSKKITCVKVVGVADELLQEEVAALVVAETSVDGEALRAFVGVHLAGYKVPRYVFQVPALPLTASGKPDQPKLKKMAEALINAGNKNNKDNKESNT